ncbi:MAG: tetratricopeptide repeat protein [Saprospiraceae bacterium]
MNYIKIGLLFSTIIIGVLAFQFSQKFEINATDYESYLSAKWLDEEVTKLDQQFEFWENKLTAAPTNQVYQQKIAALSAAKFKLTGQIKYLHQSDNLYGKLHRRFPSNVSYLHALTTNSISKHAFKAAEKYIYKAYETGEKKFISTLLMTDVNLERGSFELATLNLKNIASKRHFDYYIREMKMSDQTGDLDQAIIYMEEALVLAKDSKNKTLINWSLSNLGDMYGHQGEIKKSYQTFLQALENNPADLHSLKGIAWIAYSHDKNTTEAKRILNFLKEVHPVPDYDLLLAEIAAFEGEEALAKEYTDQFVDAASQPTYGKMYNTYLCEIYGNQKDKIAEVMKMAEAEVEERPHPVSYSLKAWAYLLQGENQKALSMIDEHVVGQTEEPNAIFRVGTIYKANRKKYQAKKYLSEAQDAAFELGPVAALEIGKSLAQIK